MIGNSYQQRSCPKPYLELHPLIATGRAVLLDHPTMLAEFRQLERCTSRLGRDTIDQPARGHDDHANSAALALVLAEEVGEAVAFNPLSVVSFG